jgi:ferredoxin
MRVRIIREECIACGVCADIAPMIFEMGEDAAEVKVEEIPPSKQDAAREAADSCPTEAIVIEE